MCISKADLDQRIRKIRNLKVLRAKVDEAIEMFENEVIEFLQETPECETTNKKGDTIFQYTGADYKATYSPQSRETVERQRLKSFSVKRTFRKCGM